jgi:hypothetical protein
MCATRLDNALDNLFEFARDASPRDDRIVELRGRRVEPEPAANTLGTQPT